MKVSELKCAKCGKNAFQASGYLKKVDGQWECRPSCDAPKMTDAAAVIAAISEDQ